MEKTKQGDVKDSEGWRSGGQSRLGLRASGKSLLRHPGPVLLQLFGKNEFGLYEGQTKRRSMAGKAGSHVK